MGNSTYNSVDELDDCLRPHRSKSDFEIPNSYIWRVVHCSFCIVGGITFLLGSIEYLPYFSHATRGAYLFTIGSFGFFMADLLDLFTNHRFSKEPIETQNVSDSDNTNTELYILFCREEHVFNSIIMTLGSLCYFIGCVYFIPALGHVDVGDILFIPGSILLFIAEGWRIYRSGSSRYNVELNCLERCAFERKFIENIPIFYADLSLCLGAVAFLVGSVLFLPGLDITEVDTRRAAAVFIIGSVLFLFSALCLFYDYFIIRHDNLMTTS